MDRAAALSTLAGAVGDLVEPWVSLEPYFTQRPGSRRRERWAHRVEEPSLLDQLRAAVYTRTVTEDDGAAGGGYVSGSPGSADALDRLIRVDAAVDDWLVRRLRLTRRDVVLPAPWRPGLIPVVTWRRLPPGPLQAFQAFWIVAVLDAARRAATCRHGYCGVRCPHCSQDADVRQLLGAASTLDDDTLAELAGDVQRWRTWAAVVTGWESPAYRPHASCPACGRVGGLRINLARRSAVCLGCEETWDSGTVGVLAEHIRDEQPDTVWEAGPGCDHSWRRVVDSADWQRGVCLRCGATEVRHRPPKLWERPVAGHWPVGVPVFTNLDALVWQAKREAMG